MAIEYSFWLDSSLTLPELGELLSRVADLRVHRKSDGEPIVLLGEGIVCYLQRQSDRGRALSMEIFAIETRLCVTCRLDKFDLFPKGMQTLSALCTELLRRLECDLVMMNDQGPQALVQKREGRIAVDVRCVSAWKEAVGALDVPYEERELPSM